MYLCEDGENGNIRLFVYLINEKFLKFIRYWIFFFFVCKFFFKICNEDINLKIFFFFLKKFKIIFIYMS